MINNPILEYICDESIDLNEVISTLNDKYMISTESNDDERHIGMAPLDQKVYNGIIQNNMRINPTTLSVVSYKLDSSFIEDFALFIRNTQIKNDKDMIMRMSQFCTYYFGITKDNNARNKFLNDYAENAFESTTTDEEYFDKLNNLKISDFKNKRLSECTEYSSLTQQCLSLLDIKSSLVLGELETKSDTKQHNEFHAFNVCAVDDQKYIIDTANPRISYLANGKINGLMTTILKTNNNLNDLCNGKGISIKISNRQKDEQGNYNECDDRTLSYTASNEVVRKILVENENETINNHEVTNDENEI